MAMAILVISVMPAVLAAGVGTGVDGGVTVEEFPPMVFQCGERILWDDIVQPWRFEDFPLNEEHPEELYERAQHYLFDGERYTVTVLVFDKNKIDDVTVDIELEGESNVCTCVPTGDPEDPCEEVCINYDDFANNCVPVGCDSNLFDHCNVRIDEENIDSCDSDTMEMFECSIDILDSETMYGLVWMNVVAYSGINDEEGSYEEIARWFMNPMVSLSVSGDLDFEPANDNDEGIRPGTYAYSNVLLENTAEGGVLLDMFITGNNWPSADVDPLARCQFVDDQGDVHGGLVNYLPLGAIRYYAENGGYSTRDDADIDDADYDGQDNRDIDDEGYVNIHRQLNSGFEEEMFDEAEIIQAGGPVFEFGADEYGYRANVLYPGSAGMSLTFRLDLPEPCYGEFATPDDGGIFFWGEAI